MKTGFTMYEKETPIPHNAGGGIQSFERIRRFRAKRRLKNDPRTIELYEAAIKEGKERDRTVRIMVIGCYGQGKSSLVKRLSGQSLDGVESTNGIDVHICKGSLEGSNIWEIKHSDNIPGEAIKRLVSVARLQLQKSFLDEPSQKSDPHSINMDTNTQDKLASQTNMATSYGDSSGTKAKRKITMQPSYSAVEFKRELTKSDSVSDSPEEKSLEFNIWDFGGQFVFYATHQLFHARQAIYILVFNIANGLDEVVFDDDHPNKVKTKTMAEYMKFWVNSVHTFVGNEQGTEPPIFLVGTHLDMSEEHFDIDDRFEEVRKIFDNTSCAYHIQAKDFAVSNTNPDDRTLTNIRSALIECYEKRSKDQFVPAKWIPLERSLKKNRNLKIISFEKVKQIDSKNEIPVNSEEQLKIFLQYHHEKGTFFYFESENDAINHIVLEPTFLIDAFRCIITAEKFCRFHPNLRKSWYRLRREAILEGELLRELWSSDPEKEFMKFEKILLFFMQKHRIIAEALAFEGDIPSSKPVPLGFYIVPSLLEKSADRMIEDFLKGKWYTKVSYGYLFEYDTVVCTIYNRVTAAILGRWPVLQFQGIPLIYENVATCKIDISHTGMLKMMNSTLELLVVSLCPGEEVSGDVCDIFRRFVEKVIEQELHKFQRNHGHAFKEIVRCHHDSHGYSGSLEMYEIERLHSCNKDKIGCPDHCSHAIHILEALGEWLGTEIGSVVIPKRELTEKELSRFSTAIGRDWEYLARKLCFPESEIEQVCMDKQTTPSRIYEILRRWRTRDLDGGTLDVLVKAVQECSSFITVNNDAVKNLIDGIL